MAQTRPNPDELLSHVQAEEARAGRGHLRIFFGAVAGVGKTYAMLEAARGRRATGADIVVGYVEPHGRVETERLMEGLERLPTLAMNYRGVVRQEFNLDEALAWIARVKPKRAILTNLHSDMDYAELRASLPANVEPAYDGMTFAA